MWDVEGGDVQARGQTCVKWPIVEICLRMNVTRPAANSRWRTCGHDVVGTIQCNDNDNDNEDNPNSKFQMDDTTCTEVVEVSQLHLELICKPLLTLLM